MEVVIRICFTSHKEQLARGNRSLPQIRDMPIEVKGNRDDPPTPDLSPGDATIQDGLCNQLYSMATRPGKTNIGCGRVKVDKQYGYGHCGLWQTERLWESPSGLTPGLVDTFSGETGRVQTHTTSILNKTI